MMTWISACLRTLADMMRKPEPPAELSFEDQVREQILLRSHFFPVRKLPTGEWCGCRAIPTGGALYVGLNTHGIWTAAFAFPTYMIACDALEDWDGRGCPPGWEGGRI